jgi:hypothetical protein
MSPAEKQAREEMLDAKMRERASKAYDKAMPEPDTTTGKLKGQSIMDSIRKYAPEQAAEVEESEANTQKYGESASKDFKEGKYGSAALNAAKGLGSAADTMLFKSPKAAGMAAGKRLMGGEKKAAGGQIKKMSSGGMTASKRADGIAQRGKTRGKMC